ncbi:MAG: rod shape-determining protein MreC [Sphingorhabdus sp.]
MAPPIHRRPGYSRKAQYSLFATYVLAIAGTVFAALLLLISIADPTGFAALRNAASETVAPVSRFFDSVRRTSVDMSENLSAYFDAASKNKALAERVAKNRTKLIEADALRLENRRLRSLLDLVESEEANKVAIGRLISSSASSSRRIATLSIGSSQGVAPGQPVRGPSGLIGRIIEAGPNTAKVLLISDAENVIPVLRLPDGLPALASGMGNGLVMIRPVDLGVNPFKKGDIISTSGNGGLYPPNVPYARVIRKTSDGAMAMPLAAPGNSPYVIVMRPYQAPAKAALDKAQSESPAASGE